MRRPFPLLLAAATLLAPTPAQNPGAGIGHTSPPTPARPTPPPSPQEVVSENGTRLWAFPGDLGDQFEIMVLVGVGSRDQRNHPGLPHLLQHALLTGTTTATSAEIDERLHTAGGARGGETGKDHMLLWVRCPLADWQGAVRLLADELLRPAFDRQDVARAQQEVLAELAAGSHGTAVDPLEAELYRGTPLAEGVGGDARDVRALRDDDLREFRRQHFRAGNVAVAVAGRVGAGECLDAVREAFAPLAQGDASVYHAPLDRRIGTVVVAPRRGDTGTRLTVGWHLPLQKTQELALLLLCRRHLEDAFATALAAHGIGGEPAAELVQYEDSARLQLQATVVDQRLLPGIATAADAAVAGIAEVDPVRALAIADELDRSLVVNDTGALAHAMRLCWFARRNGDPPAQLQAAIRRAPWDLVARYAADHFVAEARFSAAPVTFSRGFDGWLLLVAVLLGLALADACCGFRVGRRLLARLQAARRRRRRGGGGGGHGRRRPTPIVPISGDELEKSIQQFFEDEGRDPR